jgi:aminoglycoside/choline kinase family phosphotransferase
MNAENVQNWYRLAIDIIIQLQKCATVNLPPFDKAHMLGELNLFVEWFLKAYLKLSLQTTEEQMIADSFAWIVAQIEHQPQVLIHRDFHSRNLMIIDDQKSIGVIDFQDAMKGPITYDLVSLLKDCYIQWSQETVFELLNYFHQQSPLVRGWSINDLQRAFDVCGLQRDLKVLGVFSRLYLRDNKAGYLKDLPLTLHYVRAALEGVSELAEFYQFIDTRIQLPCIAQ